MIRPVGEVFGQADYYDWLADEKHDNVFSDSYRVDSKGRRRVASWVDEDQYMDDHVK